MIPCGHVPAGIIRNCPYCRLWRDHPFHRKRWGGSDKLDLTTVVIERPCHGRHPRVTSHPECPICQRWETDEPFRKEWEEYLSEIGSVEIPCRHRGPLVPLSERGKYNLDTLRDWHRCKRGFGDNGIVCACRGCNSLCVGYELPDSPSDLD